MEELLSYSHVDIAFRGNTVVHDVSFELHPGEILGIVGESGSGKSTLGRVICGLLKPDSGELKIHGTSVYASRSGRFIQIHSYHSELYG